VTNAEHSEEVKKEASAVVRQRVRSLKFLSIVMFVLLIGASAFLNNLNTTVRHVKHTVNRTDKTVSHVDKTASNTDEIVSRVAGPEAQKQQVAAQAKVIDSLVSQLGCQDQRNLQKLIDNLVAAGMTQFSDVQSVVEPKCQLPQGGTP
jgi:hypothetical protein